ncbi:hypothetical protein F5880DRAFT_1598743 [Lentinula raphanica]|nr:hypothetical protein F5880DRAFT_1598743 [Lentinula raphanica]
MRCVRCMRWVFCFSFFSHTQFVVWVVCGAFHSVLCALSFSLFFVLCSLLLALYSSLFLFPYGLGSRTSNVVTSKPFTHSLIRYILLCSQTGWGTRTGIGNIAEATAAMDKQDANANANCVNGSGGNDNNNNKNHNNANANANGVNSPNALGTSGTTNEKTGHLPPRIVERHAYASGGGCSAGDDKSGDGSYGASLLSRSGSGGGGNMVRRDLSGRSVSASSSSRMDVIEESYRMR